MNRQVADRFDEAASLLEQQQANPFRVQAYRNAAETIRTLPRGVGEILHQEGLEGLDRLPTIGPALARAISLIVDTGRFPMLDRLRGEHDPIEVLTSVPGVGPKLAQRLHDELGIATLEALEAAAHDGRLAKTPGFGEKRVAGIRDALATRLGRRRTGAQTTARDDGGGEYGREGEPTVAELLDVDREYREASEAGTLHLIAPRRFNPGRKAWLPVLHTAREGRHYTALFSNTARAHQQGRTHDWVVLYFDGADGERQHTVVTQPSGPLAGRRVVRGRERECAEYYREHER
ncbi:MAG: helix-hairpin-helix domain-containing protein [Gemmatimonadota bacterium]